MTLWTELADDGTVGGAVGDVGLSFEALWMRLCGPSREASSACACCGTWDTVALVGTCVLGNDVSPAGGLPNSGCYSFEGINMAIMS